MKLTVFAATGGIGQHVLEQAIAAGHDVTAAVRNPEKLPKSEQGQIRIVTVDLAAPDPAALESAVDGADAVLSGLGPRTKTEVGIVSEGTQVIVDAMKAADVRRLVVVSGAGVSTVPTPGRPNPPKREPGAGFLNRYVFTPLARRLLGQHYTDVALMEDCLRDSGLDWTAVRPPLLTDKPLTGNYRTAYGHNVPRGFRLSRADAAQFMLRVIDQPGTIDQAIAVAY